MARSFIAIDWDQNQLHLVSATFSGSTVRFSRALLVEDAGTPNLGQTTQLGQLLRDRLKEFNIASAPVLACLGRDRVILKEIHYPPVPEHEEPNIVRFQAIKELSEAPEDVVIDYVPLPSEGGDRRALVHIARREIVKAYQELCQAAGLKLAGLAPRAQGMAGCLRTLMGTSVLVPPPEPRDAATAIVTVGEKWAEFAILKGDAILQTRPLTVGPGLAGEIRRNLAVHSAQQAQAPVKAVYLALSGDQSALRQKLTETLDIPVHTFDPFAGAESKTLPASGRGTFAGAIGLLHLMARTGALPVNFALVKQAHAPKDPNQRLYILAAVFLVALVGGLFAVGSLVLGEKRKELAALEVELRASRNALTKERDRSKRLLALNEWEGVSWPDELYELSARMPKITDSFRVRTLKGTVEKPDRQASGAPTGPARPGASAPVVTVNAKPSARFDLKLPPGPSTPLAELDIALRASGGDDQSAYYRAMPNDKNRDSTYDKIIFIRKRELSKYTAKIVTP